MGAIAIIGIGTILAALIARGVNLYRQGRKEAKTNPYVIKKDSLIIFDDRLFKVDHINKGRYNISSINEKESILSVHRSQIELAG